MISKNHSNLLAIPAVTLILVSLIFFSQIPAASSQEVVGLDETSTSTDQLVVSGRYADADVIKLSRGGWRMYFGVEPEVEGNQLEVYTATSEDLVTWTMQTAPVMTQATFPDAVLLDDGRIRMYFQRNQEILSAISDDGINFTLEDGVRLTYNKNKFDKDGVAAPTVVILPDLTYRMIFRADVNEPYKSTSINDKTTTLFTATSTDGLTWFRGKRKIVDGRSKRYDGYVDGPELFYGTDEKLHLRFWSAGNPSKDIDASQYDSYSRNNGKSWKKAKSFLTDILGGDPTYVVSEGKTYMFYTIYGEGIYMREL